MAPYVASTIISENNFRTFPRETGASLQTFLVLHSLIWKISTQETDIHNRQPAWPPKKTNKQTNEKKGTSRQSAPPLRKSIFLPPGAFPFTG